VIPGRLHRLAGGLAGALVVAAGVASQVGVAGAQPTVAASVPAAAVGDTILVRLEGWLPAAVTVTVCGNLAARGSQDCDLLSGRGIGVGSDGRAVAEMAVARPPSPCPCVLRAATAASDVVSTAPLEIDGMPTGPIVYPVVITAAAVIPQPRAASVPWGLIATIAVVAAAVVVVWRRYRRQRSARRRAHLEGLATPAEQMGNAA
jgi:hypothetical protein